MLTPTARKHLREAKAWSKKRWGDALTTQYFQDLEQGANYLAAHHSQQMASPELSGGSGLGVYRVREHYLIYVPMVGQKIAIVAVIRAARDIPAICRKYAYVFKRELNEIRAAGVPEA